jgi:hypothetical protein
MGASLDVAPLALVPPPRLLVAIVVVMMMIMVVGAAARGGFQTSRIMIVVVMVTATVIFDAVAAGAAEGGRVTLGSPQPTTVDGGTRPSLRENRKITVTCHRYISGHWWEAKSCHPLEVEEEARGAAGRRPRQRTLARGRVLTPPAPRHPSFPLLSSTRPWRST